MTEEKARVGNVVVVKYVSIVGEEVGIKNVVELQYVNIIDYEVSIKNVGEAKYVGSQVHRNPAHELCEKNGVL
jgi:hypothetical protein